MTMPGGEPLPGMPGPDSPVGDPQATLQRSVRLSMIVLGALVIALVLLSSVVRITGAVIGQGEVRVESQVKIIAHPTGGIIADVYVRDGDRVRAGAPLIRLDSTVTDVSATVSGKGLDQLRAQRARLIAERDGAPVPVFPAELLQRTDPVAQQAISEETRLFRIRRGVVTAQQAQLRERIAQMEEQIRGYQAQRTLIEPERASVRELFEKNLVTINRLNQLERTAVELDTQIAETRGRIAELRQQSVQVDQDARSQAGAELLTVEARLSEQEVRKVSSADTNDRTIIRAPSDGVVDKLAYTTIGGVIPPAETILEIVPDTDRLVIEARVSPADIDQLLLNQNAKLRFSAFDLQTTPELNGTLRYIAAENTTDPRSGMSFRVVRLEVPEQELRRLDGLRLAPGMPVETFIQTGQRSFISYLLKPMQDQLSRAFRNG